MCRFPPLPNEEEEPFFPLFSFSWGVKRGFMPAFFRNFLPRHREKGESKALSSLLPREKEDPQPFCNFFKKKEKTLIPLESSPLIEKERRSVDPPLSPPPSPGKKEEAAKLPFFFSVSSSSPRA